MKKLPILAIAVALTACQENSYTVNGTAKEQKDGKTADLIDINTN